MKLDNHNQEIKIREFSEKLAPLYELFNWKWYSSDETPTAMEIEKSILDLLGELNEETDYVSTGGLTVSKEEGGIINITWSLEKTIWLT